MQEGQKLAISMTKGGFHNSLGASMGVENGQVQ